MTDEIMLLKSKAIARFNEVGGDHDVQPLPEMEEAGAVDLPAPGFHWVLIYVDADGNVLPTEFAGDPPKLRPVRG